MTPLEKILIDRITQTGPMRLSDYMAQCLLHPEHGYYTQAQVFGRKGDFITAPGISQMFGEMIALSLGQSWIAQGRPKDAILVELGPGEGQLMADLRRIARAIPGFDQLPVHLVEPSPRLRDMQTAALGDVTHHTDVADLPDVPHFIVANEFFDALPVRQFRRERQGWTEVHVGVVDGRLSFGYGPPCSPADLAHRLADTKEADIVEHCPSLPAIVRQLAMGIARNGGAAVIVDYGDWRSLGDTLQGVRTHTSASPLETPGQIDLTAHVDFEAIAKAAPPAFTSNMTPQGVFLERLGITARANQLAQKMSGAPLENHQKAHRRLVHPDEMGGLFKAIGLAPNPDVMPAGFTDPA